jgi:hypothetical protein
MNRIIQSRNKREGNYAGKVYRYNVSYGRVRAARRRAGCRCGRPGLRERIPPGGYYGDPLGGGWGDE